MKYQITSDNIEISESMKTLAKEKFEKIESRLTEKEKESAIVRIVLNKASEDDVFKVKIDLTLPGKKYFGQERDYSLESALIKAVGEVERMRKKDDISYYDEWNEQREMKRDLGEIMLADELPEADELDDADSASDDE